MFRPAAQSALRTSSRAFRTSIPPSSRRFASTSSAAKARSSWKGTALRWGLAGAAVYYYNTSPIFADGSEQPHIAPPHASEPAETLESIAARKRVERTATTQPLEASIADASTTAGAQGEGGVLPGTPEELEEEAGQQGAFNPETGEINWDCPCLGGMAHGPCGEEFKAAFSCFVYSSEEPKGIDCIDKFRGMQECFRQYPDIYGAELEDDDEGEATEGTSQQETTQQPDAHVAEGEQAASSAPAEVEDAGSRPVKVSDHKLGQEVSPDSSKVDHAKAATEQVKSHHEPLSQTDEAVPKAWHDERNSSTQTQ